MAVGDIYRYVSVNYLYNQLGLNVLHFKAIAEAGAGRPLQAIGDYIDGRLGPDYQGLMNINASHRGGWIQKIYPGPVSVQLTSTTGQGDGAIAGDPMSKQTCGIITKQSLVAGRANRGRMYIPFPSEGSNDVNTVPSAAYMAALSALAVDLGLPYVILLGADSVDLQMCIYHRGAPATSPLVTSFRANTKWATQRRRSDYGQQNPVPF